MTKLPAGKYYIGDPCYVLQKQDDGNKHWSDILDETDYFAKPLIRNELTAVVYSTAYGDGSYLDNHGRGYGVDSGMIGAIPLDLCVNPLDDKDFVIVEFTETTECHTDGETLTFGNIEIHTGFDYDAECDDEFIDDDGVYDDDYKEDEQLDEVV